MAVEITIQYEKDLHCIATHGPSQDRLPTDAPTDNQGRGQHFSPTDLLATALGTCMLTTMGIGAKARGLNIDGATAQVIKEMGSTPRRHVAVLKVHLRMPADVPMEAREVLQKIAQTCPVAVSLAPSTVVDLTMSYG